MVRALASVQKIESIEPIEGADRIVKAQVLGWNVVVRKGEFEPGDLCVYFEIDSMLPDTQPFHFLFEKVETKKELWRLRTAKLKSIISQGLALPISAFPPIDHLDMIEHPDPVGTDVTDLLGIVKYEPPNIGKTGGDVKGSFPAFLQKTDETRIQSCFHRVKDEAWDAPVYVTTKFHGTSFTAYYDNIKQELVVCSRNNIMKDGENCYWKVAYKYDLADRLKHSNVAIQGEVIGPGLLGNALGLTELKLVLFNTINLSTFNHSPYTEFQTSLKVFFDGVPNVFDYAWYETTFDKSIDEWLELARGLYPGTNNNREGIVIRTTEGLYSPSLQGRFSIKVVNNDFLLKGEE